MPAGAIDFLAASAIGKGGAVKINLIITVPWVCRVVANTEPAGGPGRYRKASRARFAGKL